MKFTNTAYASVVRKLTAVLLFGFIILSCVPAGGNYSSPAVTTEREWVADHDAGSAVDIIYQDNLVHTPDLLVRGKFKAKDLLKRFFSLPQAVLFTNPVHTVLCSCVHKLLADRPGYYSFLFRYTPF